MVIQKNLKFKRGIIELGHVIENHEGVYTVVSDVRASITYVTFTSTRYAIPEMIKVTLTETFSSSEFHLISELCNTYADQITNCDIVI